MIPIGRDIYEIAVRARSCGDDTKTRKWTPFLRLIRYHDFIKLEHVEGKSGMKWWSGGGEGRGWIIMESAEMERVVVSEMDREREGERKGEGAQ